MDSQNHAKAKSPVPLCGDYLDGVFALECLATSSDDPQLFRDCKPCRIIALVSSWPLTKSTDDDLLDRCAGAGRTRARQDIPLPGERAVGGIACPGSEPCRPGKTLFPGGRHA